MWLTHMEHKNTLLIESGFHFLFPIYDIEMGTVLYALDSSSVVDLHAYAECSTQVEVFAYIAPQDRDYSSFDSHRAHTLDPGIQ
jgi:hypothetical protein